MGYYQIKFEINGQTNTPTIISLSSNKLTLEIDELNQKVNVTTPSFTSNFDISSILNIYLTKPDGSMSQMKKSKNDSWLPLLLTLRDTLRKMNTTPLNTIQMERKLKYEANLLKPPTHNLQQRRMIDNLLIKIATELNLEIHYDVNSEICIKIHDKILSVSQKHLNRSHDILPQYEAVNSYSIQIDSHVETDRVKWDNLEKRIRYYLEQIEIGYNIEHGIRL